MVNGIYQQLVQLLTNTVFGGDLTTAVYGPLIVEGISAIACVALISLPFVIVWRIIRRFL